MWIKEVFRLNIRSHKCVLSYKEIKWSQDINMPVTKLGLTHAVNVKNCFFKTSRLHFLFPRKFFIPICPLLYLLEADWSSNFLKLMFDLCEGNKRWSESIDCSFRHRYIFRKCSLQQFAELYEHFCPRVLESVSVGYAPPKQVTNPRQLFCFTLSQF